MHSTCQALNNTILYEAIERKKHGRDPSSAPLLVLIYLFLVISPLFSAYYTSLTEDGKLCSVDFPLRTLCMQCLNEEGVWISMN